MQFFLSGYAHNKIKPYRNMHSNNSRIDVGRTS